jgi:predicted ATPase
MYPIVCCELSPLSESALREGLTRLQAAEFLLEVSLFPDLEYAFKHALTYEVAYGGLLQDRRRSLHGKILDAMESLHAERLGERAEQLAHHAQRAERWDKAVDYFRQAGVKAFDRSANREAASAFEQALAAIEHVPQTREI